MIRITAGEAVGDRDRVYGHGLASITTAKGTSLRFVPQPAVEFMKLEPSSYVPEQTDVHLTFWLGETMRELVLDLDDVLELD